MLDTEIRRSVVAVVVALSGARPLDPLCRFIRCRVFFSDIGPRYVSDLGFLRYPGERSIVVPEATEHELTLAPGLTINL